MFKRLMQFHSNSELKTKEFVHDTTSANYKHRAFAIYKGQGSHYLGYLTHHNIHHYLRNFLEANIHSITQQKQQSTPNHLIRDYMHFVIPSTSAKAVSTDSNALCDPAGEKPVSSEITNDL